MGVAGLPETVRAHDLLRLHHIDGSTADAPPWVTQSLTQAPWVVVRRSLAQPGQLPVGVRGPTREQRWGTSIPISSVAERITPEQIVDRINAMNLRTPAALALTELSTRLATLPVHWGPTGSAGFELASGFATLSSYSDLDIVIRARPHLNVLPRVHEKLEDLPVHIDAQVDFGFGAVSFEELLSGASEVLVKTATGPALMPITQVTCSRSGIR